MWRKEGRHFATIGLFDLFPCARDGDDDGAVSPTWLLLPLVSDPSN